LKTFFSLGDTKREIDLGLAYGFPKVSLSRGEIIIPELLGEYFGLLDKHGKAIIDKDKHII